jgi:hypothetical protein
LIRASRLSLLEGQLKCEPLYITVSIEVSLWRLRGRRDSAVGSEEVFTVCLGRASSQAEVYLTGETL